MIPKRLLLLLLFHLSSLYTLNALPCSLCGHENPIPKFAYEHEEDGVNCQDLINQISELEAESDECRSLQLTAFQTECCHDDHIPSEVCSLCPENYPFRRQIQVPGGPGRRELTCGDLASEAAFLDFFSRPGDCSDTFLQRSAAWCGCPNVETECTLCPDGGRPPDPYLTENVLYRWNCESFEFVTSLLSKRECPHADLVFEFDAAAFCCPGVKPKREICSFCSDGLVMTNPEKTVTTAYGELKCGEIEKSLRLIPKQVSCDFARNQFDMKACCIDPNSPISMANKRGGGAATTTITYLFWCISTLLFFYLAI